MLPLIEESAAAGLFDERPRAATKSRAESRRRPSAELASRPDKRFRLRHLVAQQPFGKVLRPRHRDTESLQVPLGELICGGRDQPSVSSRNWSNRSSSSSSPLSIARSRSARVVRRRDGGCQRLIAPACRLEPTLEHLSRDSRRAVVVVARLSGLAAATPLTPIAKTSPSGSGIERSRRVGQKAYCPTRDGSLQRIAV